MPENTKQLLSLVILPRFRDLRGTAVILAPDSQVSQLIR